MPRSAPSEDLDSDEDGGFDVVVHHSADDDGPADGGADGSEGGQKLEIVFASICLPEQPDVAPGVTICFHGKMNLHDQTATEAARRSLRRAEAGDSASTHRLNRSEETDPAPTEEVEQVASEGPDGRGQSR